MGVTVREGVSTADTHDGQGPPTGTCRDQTRRGDFGLRMKVDLSRCTVDDLQAEQAYNQDYGGPSGVCDRGVTIRTDGCGGSNWAGVTKRGVWGEPSCGTAETEVVCRSSTDTKRERNG